MRIYEELFIIKPDATEEEIDQVIEQLTGVITSAGGAVDKVEKWGKRRLAYRVEKQREGYYVLIQFSSGPQTVKELERRLRVAARGEHHPAHAGLGALVDRQAVDVVAAPAEQADDPRQLAIAILDEDAQHVACGSRCGHQASSLGCGGSSPSGPSRIS